MSGDPNGKRFVYVHYSTVAARDDSLEKVGTLYPADELEERYGIGPFAIESNTAGSVSTIDEPNNNFPDL